MNRPTTSLILACALATVFAAFAASAQTVPAPPANAHPSPPAGTGVPDLDVSAAAQPAVAVVDRFGEALVASDLATVENLLDPEVLILETGGAERSRQEYLGHHAVSDARFLSGSHSRIIQRRAKVSGDMAWVGTESELHATRDGKPMTLLSTETMILRHTAQGWRIVHIHWSSRPKKS